MDTPAISNREADVLALLGHHLSNAEIAATLFISVRTVESHVSSLLRKLEAADRRALSRRAAEFAAAGPAGDEPAAAEPLRTARALPAPLTAFVGRVRERAELAAVVQAHRQVTAVGPGGVGKTRLALAAAADAADGFPDGVWFVDLVPVTDPARVGAAVAAALGVGEQPGRTVDEALLAALADRRALLVLDNCEQVRDGVAPFLERLLAACPRLHVLVTSRARLVVPFERVFPVPPLPADGPDSDAVALFLDRAATVGLPPDPALHDRVAALCERLDGVALAIELAAARWPTLGLDGLEAGLGDQLRTLTGGTRADDRHRSVRAVLDWSHHLLEPEDRALLRRVSVFVLPFTADAAAQMAGGVPADEWSVASGVGGSAGVGAGPVDASAVADGLGRLAEQSLLTVTPSPAGTRYRALETIRQYGTERLAETGELAGIHARHLDWCNTAATALAEDSGPDWRARFDAVAEELRSALARTADHPDRRADAHRLALRLAGLAFTRNLLGEAQQRFEQAAALAAPAVGDVRDGVDGGPAGAAGGPAGAAARAGALRQAAAVAGCRRLGDDMYRLRRAAAEAARQAGDGVGAGCDLAGAATVAYRFSSAFRQLPPVGEVQALLTEARELCTDGRQAADGGGGALDHDGGSDHAPGHDRAQAPAAAAALALAEAAVVADAFGAVQGSTGNTAAETVAAAERAVALARRSGDAVAESAALDALSGAHSWAGEPFAAADAARRRVELTASAPPTPARTHELVDALAMAAATAVGAGRLAEARRRGRDLAGHPLLAEVGDHATSWLLVADAFAGRGEEVLTEAGRFLDAWEQGGRGRSFSLGPAAASVAMVHGLRGAYEERESWLAVVDLAGTAEEHRYGYGAVFDGLVLLHHGDADAALRRLEPEAEQVWKWVSWVWLHWYTALRAEASALAGHPDARRRIGAARSVVAGNPVAAALLDRAEAVLDGDLRRHLAAAAAFDAAGCPYQAARTRLLAGGEHTAAGTAALSALGLTPV